MMATRVLVVSGLLVVVEGTRLHFEHLRANLPFFYYLPLFAIVVFLSGLAFVSAPHDAPRGVVLLSALGGAAFALLNAPADLGYPQFTGALLYTGLLSSLAVSMWIFRRQRALDRPSAAIIPIGAALPLAVALHSALLSHMLNSQGESMSLAAFLQERIELAGGFALGGLLLLADGAMERATRRMSGAAHQRAGLAEPRR